MLLAKNKTLKKTHDPRADGLAGEYTSQETRLQQKKAFSGANFLIGDAAKSKWICFKLFDLFFRRI